MPRPLRFLYWNTNKKGATQQEVLDATFKQLGVADILILGECPAGLTVALQTTYGLQEVPVYTFGEEALDQRIYVRTAANVTISLATPFEIETLAEDTIIESQEVGGVLEQRIRRLLTNITRLLLLNLTVDGTAHLLASIHFPSKKFQDEISQLQIANSYKQKLLLTAAAPAATFGNRIIVVGDFNMNPFDAGMVEPLGFHALGNRDLAHHSSALHWAPSPLFYNPCWALLGDYFPDHASRRMGGSHYYKGAYSGRLHWHLFDQVLVSEALVEQFHESSLTLVEIPVLLTEMKSGIARSTAQYADHLPLSFTLTL